MNQWISHEHKRMLNDGHVFVEETGMPMDADPVAMMLHTLPQMKREWSRGFLLLSAPNVWFDAQLLNQRQLTFSGKFCRQNDEEPWAPH